jgi:hypothetical protein
LFVLPDLVRDCVPPVLTRLSGTRRIGLTEPALYSPDEYYFQKNLFIAAPVVNF